jgi:hypothetical protein
MSQVSVLDREEYIEQAYFFRTFRERLLDQWPAQEILSRLNEELLSSTRLPWAVQFLAAEMKHTGLLSSGFARLPHYFTRFQTFVIQQAEEAVSRFPILTALLVLEREAQYRANQPTAAGLFVYQFETIARNRLGYREGFEAMAADPFYDADWQQFILSLSKQMGDIDFADLVYLRSELYVREQRRTQPDYLPPVPVLFGEKEGKIARASRGRDPLYLFAALQRQLGYPEVPRYRQRDDEKSRWERIENKLRELEMRLKLAEAELRGTIDLSQFGKPELLQGNDEEN